MTANRAKGSVGEGESGKKSKVTQHVGGQSVSEKSQAMRTSKNLFEKSNSKTQYFVRQVKGRQMTTRMMDVDVDMWSPRLSGMSGLASNPANRQIA